MFEEVLTPDGGIYIWTKVKPGLDGSDVCRGLAQSIGMITQPGEAYGLIARGFVRIAAVAKSSDDLAITLDLLEAA